MNKLLKNRVTIPWTPFYRRYPYSDGISINSADARGLVDFEMGVFCNRIPKAANSSVVTNLAYHKLGYTIPDREAKKLFTTPSELRQHQVANISSLFSFAFVRNPYTRVLSAFLDKVERRANRNNRDVSFLEFLEYLERGGLYSNAHWAPQHSLLLLPFERFDFFGKTENLNKDLSYVLQQLGLYSESDGVLSALSNSTGASKKIDSYYDKETRLKVKELYSEDFNFFGYSSELPR
ncbi:MAG: sulfotransferase family protein [Pseudomonadota bacterium]